MTHLDEGTILAIRDAVSVDASAHEHLHDCSVCLGVLEETRGRSAMLTDTLAELDEPTDTLAAKSAVRARLDSARSAREAPAWRKWHLGRAAAILLVTTGAAFALPGSPVRSWWAGSVSDTEPSDAEVPPQSRELQPGGIAVEVPQGRILVVIHGATPGTELEVTWVDELTARISAPVGSTFTYSDGRAEVDAVPGVIRVELPRGARMATVEVDGRRYLQRTPQGLEVPGPAVERTEDRIRFLIPER